jgi:hypothetical protein
LDTRGNTWNYFDCRYLAGKSLLTDQVVGDPLWFHSKVTIS